MVVKCGIIKRNGNINVNARLRENNNNKKDILIATVEGRVAKPGSISKCS